MKRSHYIRADRQLATAGMGHIVIHRGLWGPYPHDTRLTNQRSQSFDTWQAAVQAVLGGFRPTPLDQNGQPLPNLPDPDNNPASS